MDNNLHLPPFKPINILIDEKFFGSCVQVNFEEKLEQRSTTISIIGFKKENPLEDDFMISLLEEACESFKERLERYYYQKHMNLGLIERLDLVLLSYVDEINKKFKAYYNFSTTKKDKKALREQYYYVLEEFTSYAENLIGEGEI